MGIRYKVIIITIIVVIVVVRHITVVIKHAGLLIDAIAMTLQVHGHIANASSMDDIALQYTERSRSTH